MSEASCRRTVKERAGGACERCGRGGDTTMHHRKKRGQGGAWAPGNIVAVCGHGTAGCHGHIEHNPNAAEAEGFHVRPWQNPDDIPVLYRSQLAYLREDGSVDPVLDT